MNLQALTERATNGEVRELELLSLEGGFYLARVRLDHGQFTLLDDIAKPMHLRSINHLRELLQFAPPFPCVLVQQCVHDEMCGSREGPIESLRIPFSLNAPW
ncbi:DUF6482 family protein [Pseudomonas arsenicoxydans]|uniref:Metal ABC transporter ATPase n=1 Tax=Pseudomonas arsenicoxydans TaxID=702115 RepID=A0A4P6G6X5_9PSED|nr:DUF6482 family protein [Pseudomonas arsenicoxydans]QAY86458.1 metal ABC transporter ATPase [Pseudomonas arsenicoxydans]